VAEPNTKKGFLLRLPQPLFDELRRWAGQDMRSINGQIEWVLRDAVKKRGRAVDAESDQNGPERDPPATS
jgi:hypothetical protein